jgi:hypothetical protein
MPRANRYFLPGYVWHITHQCREGSFNRSKCSNRSIAALRSSRQTKSFGQVTFARDRAVICTGSLKQRRATAVRA